MVFERTRSFAKERATTSSHRGRQPQAGASIGIGRLVLASAAVRWSGLIAQTTLTILAPPLFGAEAYGKVIAALSVPYLVQATLEPVLNGITIQSVCYPAKAAQAWVGRAVRDSIGYGLVAMLGTALFLSAGVAGAQQSAARGICVLAVGYVPLAFAATHVTANAYAVCAHRIIAASHISAGIAWSMAMLSLRAHGPQGLLAGLLAGHLVHQLVLLSHRPVRRATVAQFRAAIESWGPGPSRSTYLAALAPRAILILLSAGTLLCASTFWSPTEVAALRLTLSIVTAAACVIPISPEVLQRAVAAARQNHDCPSSKIVVLLCSVFAAACSLSLLSYVFSPIAYRHLLALDDCPFEVRSVLLAIPFFAVVGPMSSYLFAMCHEGTLRGALLAASCVFFGAFIAGRPPIAFTATAMTFVLCAILCETAGQIAARRRAAERGGAIQRAA